MTQVRLLRFFSASLVALGVAFSASPARAQVAEAEPNNACLSAQNLGSAALPLSVNGDLTTPPTTPDVDYYRFNGTPGERIIIRQRGAATDAGTLQDPYLGAFNVSCMLIEYADYDYDSGNWLDAKIELTVPEDGAVVIAASSAYDWQFLGNGNGDGTYTLEVEKVALAEAVGGRLVDSRTGLPVAGAWVYLQGCQNGDCWYSIGFVFTGADGFFRFEPGTDTMWDNILRAGDYSLSITPPEGYMARQTPIFSVAEGQDLDLGNVTVGPVTLVGSITGRAVDLNTREPLAGNVAPFAMVELEECAANGTYCSVSATQHTDAQGNFRFQSTYYGYPLRTGRYRVRILADQYSTTVSPIFGVTEDQEHYNTGDIALKSFPVRLTLASGCGAIPSQGGSCSFTVRVTNGGTALLKADTWTLVNAIGVDVPGETTKFPAGPTRSVMLAPSASATLSYSFDAQASLLDGTTVCARAYASDKKDPFMPIGMHDLFCLRKGGDGFEPLTEKQKREALKNEKAQD
ncbi:MAG TPA: carboxypeptidase regulatory-like domain-containing protein [Thermoanaerobaculia bacterium]